MSKPKKSVSILDLELPKGKGSPWEMLAGAMMRTSGRAGNKKALSGLLKFFSEHIVECSKEKRKQKKSEGKS